MAKQLAFYFDASSCIGCKACQVACKDKNNLPIGVLWRRVYEYQGGVWIPMGDRYFPNNVFAYYVSTACQHCENPPCKDVCPAAAISKRDDGVVLIDQTKCIGCRLCGWVCPYDAPQYNDQKGVMTKCTFCEDLLANGEEPACVNSCPMRSLEFGDLTELQQKYGDLAGIEPLPVPSITNPALVITPHPDAQLSGQGTGWISTLPEEV